jgi:hypothetical protein
MGNQVAKRFKTKRASPDVAPENSDVYGMANAVCAARRQRRGFRVPASIFQFMLHLTLL